MNIKKQTILLLLSTIYINADDTLFIDSYRNKLSQILIDTSNTIDCFFVENNDSVSSTTHAEFSTSIATETHLNLAKDVRFKIRVDLPKIKKSLKLIIEDENSDDVLYDETRLQNGTIKDKRYYARLEFLTAKFKNFTTKLSSGVRIRSKNLVPYVNHYANYNITDTEKLKSNFSNHFRFYSDGELEDYLDFTTVYKFKDDLSGIWRNTLRYDESDKQVFFMDYSLLYKLDSKKQITVGLGATDMVKNFKDSKYDNFNIHGSFFHIFHKSWMYYEVAPSVLMREMNDYGVSYRLFLNFGIYFNNNS